MVFMKTFRIGLYTLTKRLLSFFLKNLLVKNYFAVLENHIGRESQGQDK